MRENLLQPDSHWLLRLHQGEHDALAPLMGRYYTILYNYAISFSGDDGLVKDCIQEVFIDLWQRRENARSILSLKYYLLRAVKNKVLKSIGRQGLFADNSLLDNECEFYYEFSIEGIMIEKQLSDEKAARLKKLIAGLSKRQREIIHLKYYQHLDHGQIAELMNITTQSVYNLLHETLQRLKSLWRFEFVSG
ncbi:MAG TPA: sigma-70 family RNA polymerase sigma factor [Puia sp.]|nr:sigma-70 family RNA polymerase sigma factor [Puia sp.]